MGMTEADRVGVLHESAILETPPEALFDDVTALAAQTGSCPVALLGFVDSDREWIKSRYRWNLAHLPRPISFANAVVDSGDLLVINDVSSDPRFVSNPLVLSEPKIRFFAGAPIISSEGLVLGALQIFDRVPKQIPDSVRQSLRVLASQVSAHLSMRRRFRELEERVANVNEVRAALTESEDRFRDLFEHVDDLIVSIRSDGRIMHVNGASSSMLGFDPQVVSQKSILDLVHYECRDDFRKSFDRILATGVRELVETTFLSDDGRRVVVEGSINPKMVDGFAMLARAVFRDITDRKRSEVELGQARDAALESARLKSQFLANVSHEIRTPIHSIVGMIGLLLDSPLTPEQKELASTARSSADALLAMLNNILHVARLESGKLSVSVADFDLVTTVERVIDVMQIAASEKSLTLVADFDDRLPAIVRGDPGRYRQIVVNLINNAVKFTEKGKITARVSVERETETHTLIRCAVSDTGNGIPADVRPRIFQTFTQGDATTTRQHGGIGVGLSIAKQLVDLMGGVISFDSRTNEGTTFWFTIPFEKRVSERLAVAGTKNAFPGARVLILDESETNRKLLQHYVAAWGMRSRVAVDAEEALDRLRSEAGLGDPYRAVIFDRRLKGRDGFSLASEIKSDPNISTTGLVMLTHLGEQIDDEQARKSGVSAYLAKPVDRSELFDCLTVALAKEVRHRVDLPEQYVASPLSSVAAEPVSKELREKARILLAEDKPLNQKLTLSQLRSLGYTAEAVSNGSEVIEALRQKSYDVILMDCQMPLMDGYETTMEIRRREGNGRHTKIIAMTANALEGDREKCLAAGMDDYLPKPTRREDLESALARCFTAIRTTA